MLHRLLCTTTSPLDATSFHKFKTVYRTICLRAGTEARLATGGAVACGRAAPAVLRAAVTEGRALASETAGAGASTVGRDLLGGLVVVGLAAFEADEEPHVPKPVWQPVPQ